MKTDANTAASSAPVNALGAADLTATWENSPVAAQIAATPTTWATIGTVFLGL